MEPISITIAAGWPRHLAWAKTQPRPQPVLHSRRPVSASRLTSGNRVWPTQVAVFPNRVVRYTPRFGHFEETCRDDQVAWPVDSGPALATRIIETTGGSQPIRCQWPP
jgi:hypothetical protein